MTQIVSLHDPRAAEWADNAAYLRELADRMERGEISECVVVLNDKRAGGYERWATFDDRWRMLGALEYAKTAVNGG